MATTVTESWLNEIISQLEENTETTTRIEDSPYYSPMAMPATFYLGMDITMITLQTLSIIGNGFIITLFIGTRKLRKNMSLRLLLLLCVTDFLFALSTLPYSIYYTVKWNPVLLDHDPIYIVTSAIPLIVEFKVNLITSIMIAVDRLQAMKAPLYYRKKNQTLFVSITIAIGLLLSIIELILEYKTTNFNVRKYNCSGLGCFQNPTFRAYWGISNMALDGVALILTLWVAIELSKLRGKSVSMTKKDEKQMIQTNKLSLGILVNCFLFLMIPSSFVGIVEVAGLKTFKIFGQFYSTGLLFAGVTNSIIYISLHVELRQAAIRLIKKGSFMKETSSVTTVNATGTMLEGL